VSVEQYVLEGTAANFDRLVLENSHKGLVVVDYWAPWAGPSMRQREMLIALTEQLEGRLLLVSVDTDKEKALAQREQVKSLPLFKLYRNGRVIEEVRGVQPEADYRAIIENHLATMTDKVRLAAAEAWNAGERDQALQILAEAAVNDPDNLNLPAMMAKLLIRAERFEDAAAVLNALPQPARDSSEIASLLAHLDFILAAAQVTDRDALVQQLEDGSIDLDGRFGLAAVALLADDYEAALLSLMAILGVQRDWQEGKARRGLLAVFDVLGGDHPLVQQYRSELFRLIH